MLLTFPFWLILAPAFAVEDGELSSPLVVSLLDLD